MSVINRVVTLKKRGYLEKYCEVNQFNGYVFKALTHLLWGDLNECIRYIEMLKEVK